MEFIFGLLVNRLIGNWSFLIRSEDIRLQSPPKNFSNRTLTDYRMSQAKPPEPAIVFAPRENTGRCFHASHILFDRVISHRKKSKYIRCLNKELPIEAFLNLNIKYLC